MSLHERLSGMLPPCRLHVSPMMLMFGRALLQPGLVKYAVVAERKGAQQGAALMSPHEVIFEV